MRVVLFAVFFVTLLCANLWLGCSPPSSDESKREVSREPSTELRDEPQRSETSLADSSEPSSDRDASIPEDASEPAVEPVIEQTEPTVDTDGGEFVEDAATPDPHVPDNIVSIGTQEACKTLTKGPFRTTKASSDHTGAPEVLIDHNGYVFKLYAGQSGYFKFDAWRRRHHYLLLSQDIPVTVEDSKKQRIPILASTKNPPVCTAIAVRHKVPLLQEAWYYFKLGPVTKETNVIVTMFDGHLHD